MATAKLTVHRIGQETKQAKASGKAVYLWDADLKGFGVRISPKGQVSWLLQKWQGGRGGKSQRVTFAAKSLKEAQQTALGLAVEASKGVDLPKRKALARKAKREALQAPSLSEAVAKWVRQHSQPGRYWDELEQRFDNQIIPALGKDSKVHELTKADVQSLLDDSGSPRLTYAALSPFLKWCMSRDFIPSNPMASILAPAPSSARERTLSDTELKQLWSATSKLPLYGNFYRLLLLTMQRRSEVAGLRLSEVSGELWTIPGSRTKNGKPHLVPLSPQALTVIEDAKQELDTGCPYLFPTVTHTNDWRPICDYSGSKERLDKLMPADIPSWRTHDLRRTGRTNLGKLKVPREHAEKVLNHVPKDKLQAVYNLYEYLDEKRHALSVWGLHVSRLTENSSGNSEAIFDVMELRRSSN